MNLSTTTHPMQMCKLLGKRLLIAAAVVALTLSIVPTLCAQGRSKSAPHDGYFFSFGAFWDGDFATAAKNFRDSAKSGVKSTEGRWIDSICYHTMLGESYYHMGDNASALDQYSSALQLYLAHRDWMLRVDFPANIDREQNLNTNITWGVSTRTAPIGHFPDKFQSMQGRLDNDQVVQKGGVVSPPILYPVHVSEVVRCTAVALSRRRELMGPVSEHDPLTAQLVDALSRRPGPPNHWAQCWIELELGLAYAAAGKIPQAVSELQKAILAGGTFDHPLTCLALLELGKLAFEQGKYDVALTMFSEATFSAAYFDRYEVMEEAFRYAAVTHVVSGQKGPMAGLAAASGWAKQKRIRMMNITVLTSLAETLDYAGDAAGAADAIAQARREMARAEMANGAGGARLNYQAAKIFLRAGNPTAAKQPLAAALAYQQVASKWLFHIALADRTIAAGGVTERIGDILYTQLLREPNAIDFSHDPLDTLAMLSTPHPLPYEHWLELVLLRKEQERAIEIADRIRRHRFFSALTLGGRVHALRWILEAPQEMLSQTAVLQKQDLQVRYPILAELTKQVARTKAALDALPLATEDQEQRKQQAALLLELAKLSTAEELLLEQVSLERVPSEFAFPPIRTVREVQGALADGVLVLVYLQTSRNVYAFAFTKDKYATFVVETPAKVRLDTAEMLRLIGNYDRTQPVDPSAIASEAWKVPAAKILKQLTNNAKAEDWAKYREVVVVPDGPLWYVPFEALQIPLADGKTTQSLATTAAIRYTPMMSLVLPDGRGKKPLSRTAVIVGRMIPREDEAIVQSNSAAILGAIPGSTTLPTPVVAPGGTLSATIDRLILYGDIDEPSKGPLEWSPLQLDRGKPLSTLSDWMMLPFAGPDEVIIPGYHTPAEYALKRGGTGDEVFLSVMGLLSSGSRSLLLSRWRVGGQSTQALVREYVQELPHASASEAWRRSVQLFRAGRLDPAAEPRLKSTTVASDLPADHPFFWGGYMLVDTASQPGVPSDPVDAVARPAPAEEKKAPPPPPAEEKDAAAAIGVPGEAPKKEPMPEPADGPIGPRIGDVPPAPAPGAGFEGKPEAK